MSVMVVQHSGRYKKKTRKKIATVRYETLYVYIDCAYYLSRREDKEKEKHGSPNSLLSALEQEQTEHEANLISH